MDCVYRNQRPDFRTGVSNAGCGSRTTACGNQPATCSNQSAACGSQPTGWCGQMAGSQSSRYLSGMMGYPLAMAYVPWQQWKTPYDPAKGLSRGTIFEDLDLPFEKERCRGV